MRFDYAQHKAAKRLAAAQYLSDRVTHPVTEETRATAHKKASPIWAIGAGVLALALHASATAALLALREPNSEIFRTETAVFQVVEQELPARDEVTPEEDDVEVVQSELQPAASKPLKAKPMKRVKVARADPVNMDIIPAQVEPKRRAVVGITMTSTVTGGSGPTYAVGNTRMGSTGEVQSTEKIESLSKGTLSSSGGVQAVASVNRQATFIPTVSSNFTRPKRISQVDLPYPAELKSKGIEGNVMVLIVIDESGRVQKVRILKSSGYREFDEAALRAAEKEVYSPAFRDGKAVEYNLKYTYRFRMKGA